MLLHSYYFLLCMMAMQYAAPSTGLSTSRSCIALSSSAQLSCSVKIGGLWKRSQGVSRFTKANYKHRVFILTEQALSYYAGTVDRVGQMKGRVALDSVRAVEFVDLSAFNLAHTMQVVYVTKKSGFVSLYIIATTTEECSDWVATLRQACYFNRDMLMHFHPGAFIKNKWTCCQHHGRTTLGCQPTYHLLTRSSSRYAQMRRKDTLTNATQQGTKEGGRGRSRRRGSRECRSATTNVASTDVEDIAGIGVCSDRVQRSSGHGLSNSYMELSGYHPHMVTLSSPPPTARSRRSSKNSSDSVGTLMLNRISVSEIAMCEMEEEKEGGEEGEGGTREHSGYLSQSLTSRHLRCERGRKGGRGSAQVAPAWSTGSDVPSSPNRYSYEIKHRTLPRSFKSSHTHAQSHSHSLNNSWNHSLREERGRVGHEVGETTPIPPPRLQKTFPSTGTVIRHTNQTPSPCHSPANRRLSNLKHSNTFAVGGVESMVKTGRVLQQGRNRDLSQSMGALTRPLIEPKVSHSNPNIIHV